MNEKNKKEIYYFPHEFKTSVELLSNIVIPEIILTESAYMDMVYIISQSKNDEISWLGSVNKVENIYTIDNVYLFEQTVSATTTEISEKSIVKLGTEMLKQGLIKEVNKLKFWGHLHPGNSTSPSHVDNAQIEVFNKRCKDYFIRGIFGRKGRAEFSLFNYSTGICFNDIEWKFAGIANIQRRDYIRKQIEEKVKKEVITVFPFHNNFKDTATFAEESYFKYGHYHH